MPDIRKPIFVRPIDLGNTMATSSALAGHAVFNLGRHRHKGVTWKADGPSVWLRGNLGSVQSIDFATIMAANALPGTTWRLRLGTSQAEVDGTAPYDSGVQPFISPAITRSDGLYHSFLELDAVEEASWWRIDIAGHTGEFEASMLVMGERIEPSRFYNYDYEYGTEDLGSIEIGRFGVMDEEPGDIWRTLDFALGWQTEAEFEASFRPLIEELGRRGVIYVCFDPSETTYRQAKTYFGLLRKPGFARGIRKPRTFLQEFSILSMF